MNVLGRHGVTGARRIGVCFTLAAWALLAPLPVQAALTAPERAVLLTYLEALHRAEYDRAFAVLTVENRRYFGSSENFASIFRADRFKLDAYRIVGSTKGSDARGVLAFVSERVHFFDHAHQVVGSATVRIPYGLVAGRGGASIDDPLHPWRALTPADAAATKNQLRVLVRKVSFFTGRVEVVLTFQNLGDRPITVLPFLRSTLRDASGTSHVPIATRIPALTDTTLYTGLNLPGSGQYTGAINFRTPDRYVPKRLSLTVSPALTDGTDAPFDVVLPALDLK